MPNDTIYRVVRDPDKRYERDGVVALTPRRVLEIFPGTASSVLQEDALLVEHPWLAPRCRRKLVPARYVYKVVHEEEQDELCEALIALGATDLSLAVELGAGEVKQAKGSNDARCLGVKGRVSVEKFARLQEHYKRVFGLKLSGASVDVREVDEEGFLDKLVYNRDNPKLRMLFRALKAGKEVDEYRLEIRQVLERNRKLEARIAASYKALAGDKINFEREYQASSVEGLVLVVTFGNK